MDDLQPSALPTEILKRKEAVTLYTVAVLALAIIAGLAMLGGMVLAFAGRAVPGELVALGGVAVGALAAMVTGREGQ